MNPRVQFDLDPAMYDGAADPTAVYADLEKAVRLDLRHHYSGPVGARYWLSLCEASQYSHQTLADVIDAQLPNVLRAVMATTAGRSVDLVSLGPGSGDIDCRLLGGLQKHFETVGYIGIDISFELLHHAMTCILRESGFTKLKLPVRAIWGDFTRSEVLLNACRGNTGRVVCLTGFTFGNHNEAALLQTISRTLAPGDLLFVDARLHQFDHVNGNFTDDQVRSLVHGYASDASNRFAFGPVELATTCAARDVAFGYEVNRNITAVPNAINVITYCKELHTRLRFTGEPIHVARLDLGATTLYNYLDLVQWLSSTDLHVAWHTRCNDIGLFVLRR